MRTAAVILCAGASRRMGRDKLILELGGKTVLRRSVEAFIGAGIRDMVLAFSEPARGEAERLAAEYGLKLAEGGSTRGESVYNALKVMDCDIVAIHDGARCLVSQEIILDSVASAAMYGSGVAAIPARDTLWKEGEVLDRSAVMAAQTPQTFAFDKILAAYEKAVREGYEATDDCAVYRHMWGEAHFSKGSVANQKLTVESDMELFGPMCGEQRTGYGEDTHRFAEGRRLILGGVDVPYAMGLLGHSDADVLTHALIDAMLGAAAMGDIGRLFPDSSAEFKDICSLLLLERAWDRIKAAGYSLVNADATIVVQQPKLAPHIDAMRENIAKVLRCDVDRISVKATTPEHTGPEGNLECVTARCVCTLKR
ncbi:MAG: 2-C-methyl-D-erythritol 2,4-cyclodiphosphate synthase [Clostridia bacterium]|nr:2-C-methyl-D-erythritol 2,4-cyclodiphosphate synthase [Clostridia bacterium]